MEDGLANWRWMIELSHTERALLLTPDHYESDGVLTAAFAQTERRVARADALEGLAPASFDCIAVPDAAALLQLGTSRTAALRRLRDALRPSTGVYVAVEEIHPAEGKRSLRAAAAQLVTRQSPLLRRAGFRHVHTYYLVQSPASPRHFIPATATALIAWDRAISVPDWRMHLRHAMYRLGLTALLLRYRLVIAQA